MDPESEVVHPVHLSLPNGNTLADYYDKGSPRIRKTVNKGDIVHFGQPPPKRVKRGHLLSDYRQKCINVTRDSRHFDVKSA